MSCEHDLIDYINRELLEGQGDDLDAETPLLELRILDSISIVMLRAHIVQRYGVSIPPEELTPTNLADVRCIASLVERLGAERASA